MTRTLCARGLTAESAHLKAFESVYLQPCDDAYLRDAGQRIYDASYTAAFPVAWREMWFKPSVWPVPLTVCAFAADSSAASASRDLSPILYWAGLALNPSMVPDSATISALSSNVQTEDSSLVITAILPAEALSRRLLGRPVLVEATAEDQVQEASVAAASLELAVQVFMERCEDNSFHQAWAATTLNSCLGVLKSLQINLVSLYGGDAVSHISNAVQCLAAYFSSPLSTNEPNSEKLTLLRRALRTAVFLRQTAKHASAGMGEASQTLLQLSCWRFENPGLRNKLAAPHPMVDWLWPIFNSIQACEESLFGNALIVDWSDGLADKVRQPL